MNNAWRAVWGALQTNTVYAARYRHLTSREHNKLTPTQAGIEDHEYLGAHHGQPRPSSEQPDYTLQGTSPIRYAGTDDGARHRPNA